ncbi:bacteriophage Mu tail sheath protein GpL family protein [Asticcacaulis biprosthecium C19]|uniref:Bacteriophage Mu tail sheath protein GpL family protein n=1 Tax=Asticcacaulis biprosthecium C19 TaxID=715226 RepID=F4QG94_9CAUL|nr:phage tail sheath subtilisin-like domain-containing protein [Asticcacaulis biprosthecium]EGF92422.1 bacteriophage Mu tail sheath protein GpL family protein [Asticcacaulis biprosthecium C19]
MDSLSFTQIPLTTRSPGQYVEFDFSKMRNGLPGRPYRVLCIGLGTFPSDLDRPVRVDSADHAKAIFGQGSMLTGMCAVFNDQINSRDIQLWGMPLGEPATGDPTAATGTFVFTGTATKAGIIALMVEQQRIQVSVAVGMTAAQTAAAVSAKINTYLDLSCTAGVSTATVTVTSRHKGTAGNSIYLAKNYDPGDRVPIGLTCEVTAMSGGTGDPVAATKLALLGDQAFDAILHFWTDATNIAAVEAFAADRAIATKRNYCWSLTHKTDSYSTLTTFAASRNSAFAPIVAMKGTPWPSWKVAAAVGGACANSIANDPATPLCDLVIKGMLPPKDNDRFSGTERELLLQAGLATLDVNDAGKVYIQLLVTTYKTNEAGYADDGLYLLTRLTTLFYISWAQQVLIAETYPRYKLGDDGGNYLPSAKVATPSQIRATLAAQAVDFGKAGLIENVAAYIDALVVTRDATDRDRVNSFQRPDLINGFLKFASMIQPLA